MSFNDVIQALKGGKGSGNFGHSGIPGKLGGLGDSVESAKEVYERYGPVGLLFVDTTHTYEQTMREYDAWRPYLDTTHVVCFDDLFRPGMSQAWRELPTPKLRLDELHPQCEDGGGFGVIWNV